MMVLLLNPGPVKSDASKGKVTFTVSSTLALLTM